MPFQLPLPKKLANAGWKVKIQDRESCEDPHVTIWFKNKRKWRVALRDGRFMDGGGWDDIADGVCAIIKLQWQQLRDEWDKRYGDVNPITSEEHDDE